MPAAAASPPPGGASAEQPTARERWLERDFDAARRTALPPVDSFEFVFGRTTRFTAQEALEFEERFWPVSEQSSEQLKALRRERNREKAELEAARKPRWAQLKADYAAREAAREAKRAAEAAELAALATRVGPVTRAERELQRRAAREQFWAETRRQPAQALAKAGAFLHGLVHYHVSNRIEPWKQFDRRAHRAALFAAAEAARARLPEESTFDFAYGRPKDTSLRPFFFPFGLAAARRDMHDLHAAGMMEAFQAQHPNPVDRRTVPPPEPPI